MINNKSKSGKINDVILSSIITNKGQKGVMSVAFPTNVAIPMPIRNRLVGLALVLMSAAGLLV
jgi:hypothetical protein